jgi:hypothetical protein
MGETPLFKRDQYGYEASIEWLSHSWVETAAAIAEACCGERCAILTLFASCQSPYPSFLVLFFPYSPILLFMMSTVSFLGVVVSWNWEALQSHSFCSNHIQHCARLLRLSALPLSAQSLFLLFWPL